MIKRNCLTMSASEENNDRADKIAGNGDTTNTIMGNHDRVDKITENADRVDKITGNDDIPYIIRNPDTGWAWVVVVASMVGVMLGVGTYQTLGIIMVELMDVFEAPASLSSLLFMACGITFTISGLFLSTALGGIIHERALLAIGGLVGAVGFATTSLAVHIEHVVLVLGFAAGTTFQMTLAAGFSITGKYFKRRIGLANGIVMAGSGLGTIVLAPVIRVLLDEYTFRGTLLIMGALLLNTVVCAALMRPAHLEHVSETKRESMTDEKLSDVLPIEGTASANDSRSFQRSSPNLTASDDSLAAIASETAPTKASFHDIDSPSLRSGIRFSEKKQREVKDINIAYNNAGYENNESNSSDDQHTNIQSTIGPTGLVDGAGTTAVTGSDHINSGCYIPTGENSANTPVRRGSDNPTANVHGGNLKETRSLILELLSKQIVPFFLLKRDGRRQNDSCRQIFGLDLFKNPIFVLFLVFIFCVTLSSESLLQFYPATVKDIGIPEKEAATLLSIMGASDMCSRLLVGWIGDFKLIERYKILVISLFVLGVSTNILFLAVEFWSQVIFSLIIGCQFGINYGLRATLLIEFFGLDVLPKTVGVELCVSGLALTVGGPLVGWLRDLTGGYKIPLHAIGSLSLLSGCLLFAIGMMRKVTSRKQDRYNIES